MASYTFETITPAQALAYNASTDNITFNPLATASFSTPRFSVAFDDPHHLVTVTSTVTHESVTFGAGIYDSEIKATAGEGVFIGSPGPDTVGSPTYSEVFGGGGDDILSSAPNTMFLDGGSGSDTFISSQDTGLYFIVNWDSSDHLYFTSKTGTPSDYLEVTYADLGAGSTFAQQQFAMGVNYVVIANGGDLHVESHRDVDQPFEEGFATILGRGLNDISMVNILGGASPLSPNGPSHPETAGEPSQLPVTPSSFPPVLNTSVTGSMDAAHLGDLRGGAVSAFTPSDYVIIGSNGARLELQGSFFTYDGAHHLTGGHATNADFTDPTAAGAFHFLAAPGLDPTVLFFDASPISGWIQADATQDAFNSLLDGRDLVTGGTGADVLHAEDGADVLAGHGGDDMLFGGAGNDVIYAGLAPSVTGQTVPVGTTYLRGEDGDDYVQGGLGFDDINGNQGNDTIAGGPGDDYVVGGKDNDLQFGDKGDDIVWGNLGNDTLEGGEGADQVRGGQGDDAIYGDAGNDYISGDRGNDTEAGGPGADIFHSFSGASLDRVIDFSSAEGDRVMLDPGTQSTVSQVGADTVIDMGNGDKMILVGVTLSSLPDGWIFQG